MKKRFKVLLGVAFVLTGIVLGIIIADSYELIAHRNDSMNGLVFFLVIFAIIAFIPVLIESFPIEKSTLRIIGRVALLLVVMGFFMPIGCNQNGFQIAEYATNIDKSIGADVDQTSGVGVWLYVLFFVSLIGGLMIIPLIMKKKIHISIDWVSLIIPIICVIVLLRKLIDIVGRSSGGLKLQIGGNVIIFGLIVSLLITYFSSFIPEKESGQLESPPAE